MSVVRMTPAPYSVSSRATASSSRSVYPTLHGGADKGRITYTDPLRNHYSISRTHGGTARCRTVLII
jgi:hypothetical protein